MALAMMTIAGAGAMAQNDGVQRRGRMDRTEMIKKRTEFMVKKYGLNDEQAAKLLELNKKYDGKTGRGMGGMQMRRPVGNRQRPATVDTTVAKQMPHKPMQGELNGAQRTEVLENMKQYEKEVQTIMTAEQYAKYKEDRNSRFSGSGMQRKLDNGNKTAVMKDSKARKQK